MYLQHFHLQRHPFRITPDITLFFPGGGRGAVLEALIYAITTGEGVIKVVSEVGSGKTMLCRVLAKHLPESVEIVYLANPGVEASEILHAIAFELKLPVDAAARQFNLLQQINDYLLRQHAAARRVVIFVEEAQNMPLATLEEIRMLANLETGSNKLLQIVLFGQPELDEKLAAHAIRPLRERITHGFKLQPLTDSEINEYLHFRLSHAGCPDPRLFTPEAVRIIARASRGLLRRINIMADKALLAAYIEHAPVVKARHARAALKDSGFCPSPTAGPHHFCFKTLLATGMALILLTAGYFLRLHQSRPSPSNVVVPATQPPVSDHGASRRPVTADLATAGHPLRSAAQEQAATSKAGRMPAEDQSSAVSADHKLRQTGGTPHDRLQADSSVQPEATTESASAVARNPPPLPLPELIAERLRVTAAWLAAASPDLYVIQLILAAPPASAKLDRLLAELRDESLIEQVWLAPVDYQGQPGIIVLLGAYESRTEASSALTALAAPLRASRPFIRRLSVVLQKVQDKKN